MAATPAVAALEAAGVDFTVTEYDFPVGIDSYGEAVATALGLDARQVGKSLVALVDDRPALAVVPVATTLDLKALARAAGAKRATMAPPADAERLTGAPVGGIAPLGHRSPLPVFVDESLTMFEVVHVSGGRRGLEISVAPAALVEACEATVAAIAR